MQVECPNVQFDYAGAELPNCATACDNIVVHDCLSYGGQSGSPIWSTDSSNYTVRVGPWTFVTRDVIRLWSAS